jgi:CSLREA domain-containing protein
MTRLARAPYLSTTQLSPGRRLCRLIRLLAPVVVPAIVVTALGCGKDAESPTSPAEPGGPDFSHTVGHKVVNSLADPGNGTCNATQCTLREAINDPQSTEISFASGLAGGTITLARPGLGGGTLVIEKRLTITGPSTPIVIQRRSTDPSFRILRITSSGIVRLTNLTIRNGKFDGPAGGGGIVNYGTLSLTRCTVTGNSAPAGGGIKNLSGTLTLTRTTVANNSAQTGGGISLRLGTLTLNNSLVADNSASPGVSPTGGGGIDAFEGTATLTNTRIVDNSTTGTGGGIRATFRIRFTLTKSTVARNSAASAGGGISLGVGGITESTVSGNSAPVGGGIFLSGDPRQLALLVLTNSTVSGNSASRGGGIFETGPLGMITTNSTIARNSATEAGGGIHSSTGEDAASDLTNSLVARNSAPAGPDVLVDPQSLGIFARFSLIGNGSGSGITNTNGNQVGTAINPIDPKIGPLANNGGPTRTHALLLGSPAIDAASTPDCPTTDQRGVLRPQGAACDIGSFERQ